MVESTPRHPLNSRIALARVARNGLWVCVLALLAYHTLFRLPFRFPRHQRLWSASYAFGFNNTVAVLGLAMLLAVAAILVSIAAHREGELQPLFQLTILRNNATRRSFLIALFLAAALYAILTFVMYSYSVASAPWLMWETRHFLYRTWLMGVYGLDPYTDFQAEYGPLLTYTPLWIYWLLSPLGASYEQAYFASHLLLNVAGLWCVYYILSHAVMPAWARIVAFAVLGIAGFAPYMGLNGVLLRYLSPFACLVVGHIAVTKILSRRQRAIGLVKMVLTVLLLWVANVLLSPEVVAAFTVAWIAYGMLMMRFDASILLTSLAAFVVGGLLCWILLPAPYYGSLLSFSEGANNLPLLPVAHLLFYIFTMFLIVPPMLASSLRVSASVNVADVAINGALGALCVLMAFGALGRCDLPHVLFYGMGASLLLMIRFANVSRIAFAMYTLTYVGVFVVLMQIVNLQVFYRVPPRALKSRHGLADAVWKLRHWKGTDRPDMAQLSALARYPRVGLPYATLGDPAVEKYVVARKQVEPDYYLSCVGVYTPAALQRKLRDIRRSEYLLVPSHFATLDLSRNSCDEYLNDIQQWFLYSANFTCRADPLDPFGEVNKFIVEHYVPVEEIGSWVVLRRNSN